MKKKCLAMIMSCMLFAVLCACGNEGEVKVVNKVPKTETKESDTKNGEETDSKESLNGYVFEVEAGGNTVSVTVDAKMETILEQLGEPVSYFESASCAFEGLDKMYTYDHYRIETYPDGETDRISMIVFLDDLVQTKEGISIGMTKEDMENAYGTGYEEKDGMIIYTKDGGQLSFLVKNNRIESVEYNSKVLSTVEQ